MRAKKTRSDEESTDARRARTAPIDYIERRIYQVRQQNVMLDSDLAILYQVSTSNLNVAVRRNLDRFPNDFMFQLTGKESAMLVLQSAVPTVRRGGRRTPPYAFTELGVAMLSSILTSETAAQINILIMRAFVKMRTLLATNKDLVRHIDEVEARFSAELSRQDKKITTHEQAITGIFKSLRELMNPSRVDATGLTTDSSRKP